MKNFIVKNTILFLFSAVLVLSAETNLYAQNSISGIIFDQNRKPVARIHVELLDGFERLIKSTETKSSGLFIFQGLSAGIYYVQIRTAGTPFKQAKERVQLGQTNRTNRTSGAISGSESIQLNLNLELDPRFSGYTKPFTNEVIYAQTVPKEAEALYEQAVDRLENKKMDEAIMLLKSAISAFPEYFLALDRLGNVYLIQNKNVEAENVFAKALDVNPKSYSSRYGLAVSQYKLGKKTEAAQNLEESAVLNTTSINAYFLLGKIHREAKEFNKAEKSLLKAKELSDNKLADIHWELALLYYHNLKRFNDAADELELYLKADPDTANKEQVKRLIKDFRDRGKQQ